jgi:hypothetical protein
MNLTLHERLTVGRARFRGARGRPKENRCGQRTVHCRDHELSDALADKLKPQTAMAEAEKI